jgi:NADH-quinone oxidoreductase subunit J
VSLGYGAIFFYVLAAMTLVSSILVISRRNPVHAAIFLVFTFFCVAGIYVTMSAEFLAAVQVLVYAGGIVVLFLFVIMLVPLSATLRPLPLRRAITALLLASLVAAAVLVVFGRARAGAEASAAAPLGTIEAIGTELFTRYALPFEVASVLLLVAMIGAVVLARRQI